MSRILFTMADVEYEWSRIEFEVYGPTDIRKPIDPYNNPYANQARGAAPLNAPAAPGTPRLRDELKGAVKGLYRSSKAAVKKAGQLTVATSRKGLKFLRRVGVRASTTTGRAASKGVGLAGRGVSKAGALVSKAGAAIGRNPKIAGAAILGGAAIGAGAYAVNRRRRSESSRYLGNYASFSRRRYYR